MTATQCIDLQSWSLDSLLCSLTLPCNPADLQSWSPDSLLCSLTVPCNLPTFSLDLPTIYCAAWQYHVTCWPSVLISRQFTVQPDSTMLPADLQSESPGSLLCNLIVLRNLLTFSLHLLTVYCETWQYHVTANLQSYLLTVFCATWQYQVTCWPSVIFPDSLLCILTVPCNLRTFSLNLLTVYCATWQYHVTCWPSVRIS